MKEEKRVQQEIYVMRVVGYHGVSLVCFYAREREYEVLVIRSVLPTSIGLMGGGGGG